MQFKRSWGCSHFGLLINSFGTCYTHHHQEVRMHALESAFDRMSLEAPSLSSLRYVPLIRSAKPFVKVLQFLPYRDFSILKRVQKFFVSHSDEDSFLQENHQALGHLLCRLTQKKNHQDCTIVIMMKRVARTVDSLDLWKTRRRRNPTIAPDRNIVLNCVQFASNLERLSLSGLQFGNHFRKIFERLQDAGAPLTSVQLEGTNIDLEGLEAVLQFRTLRILSIKDCEDIEFEADDPLVLPKGMQELNASGTFICDEHMQDLASLPDLWYLNISFCENITIEAYKTLQDSNIESLGVSSLSSQRMKAISEIETLTQVDFSGDDTLPDNLFDRVKTRSSLRFLRLDGTNLSDIAAKALSKLRLQWVSVLDCDELSKKGYQELLKSKTIQKMRAPAHAFGKEPMTRQIGKKAKA